MPYRISIEPAAQRELSKLPIDARQDVGDAISALANEPRPPGVRKLSGSKSSYRIRIRDYRVLYTIADRILNVIVIKGRQSTRYLQTMTVEGTGSTMLDD